MLESQFYLLTDKETTHQMYLRCVELINKHQPVEFLFQQLDETQENE